ncbi:nucleoside diphosphate kinase 3 isoform 1-T1 [Thomomys bottae]
MSRNKRSEWPGLWFLSVGRGGRAPGPRRPGDRRLRVRSGRLRPAAAMICLVLTIFANLFPAAQAAAQERTFLAVKPDGVQRRLVGEVVRRFERKGFKLVALKLVQASEELLREHYAELRGRPFFGRLVEHMRSGPVVAMVSGGGGAGGPGLPALTRAPAGVAGAGRGARLEGAHRGHRPGRRLARHHPRRLLRGGRQERDPRQRLAGERPPGDRAVVPRRRAAVLGGQRRALAARVAAAPSLLLGLGP